jgi:hypothetical protein
MRTALTASLIVVLVATGAAQAKPDFSGSWTNTRTDPRDGANLQGVVGMTTITIAQSVASLRITRTYGQNTVTIVLPLDGSKVKYTLEPGGIGPAATPRTLESQVQWKDDKLAITTEYRKLDGETFTTETLSLRGNELIVERVDESRSDRGPSMRGNLPAKATYTRVVKGRPGDPRRGISEGEPGARR